MIHQHTVVPDRYTRLLLTAITVLLTVIAIELWAERPPLVREARAQIPDSGLQRNVMIDEARRTNKLLEEILDHLKNKPIKVKSVDTDKSDGDTRGGRR